MPTPDIHPPSPAELARLFAAAGEADPDLADFILLVAATGARRSELVALRWSDIDLEAGRFTISRGVVAGPDGLVVKDTKTHAARRVSLDGGCVAALAAHRERADECAAVCGIELVLGITYCSAPRSTQALPGIRIRPAGPSPGCAGAPASPASVCTISATTWPPGCCWPASTCATVAGRLGHRDAATTLNVYSHFLAEADRDAPTYSGGSSTTPWAPVGPPSDGRP